MPTPPPERQPVPQSGDTPLLQPQTQQDGQLPPSTASPAAPTLEDIEQRISEKLMSKVETDLVDK